MKSAKPDGAAWKHKRKGWLGAVMLGREKRWKVKRGRMDFKNDAMSYRSHKILLWERQRKLKANSSLGRFSNKASQGILYLG